MQRISRRWVPAGLIPAGLALVAGVAVSVLVLGDPGPGHDLADLARAGGDRDGGGAPPAPPPGGGTTPAPTGSATRTIAPPPPPVAVPDVPGGGGIDGAAPVATAPASAGGARGGPRDGAAGRGDGEPRDDGPRVVVRGRVSCDGDPVPGARVRLQPAERGRAVDAEADLAGRFEAAVRGGRYVVRAWAPGYVAAAARALEVGASDPSELELALARGRALRGLLVGEDGHALVGRVAVRRGRVVAADGTLDDADLGPEPPSAASDRGGAFALDGLAEGVYSLEATAPGHATARAPAVPVGPQGGEVTLRLARGATLEGRVVDEAGTPVPEALVFAYLAGERLEAASSDAEGRYRLEGLPAAALDLFVRSRGFERSSREVVHLQPGQAAVCDAVLRAGPRIAGTLRDAEGAAVPGVTVRAVMIGGDVRRQGTSGPDGRFEVASLYPGRYELTVPRDRDDRATPLVREEVDVAGGVLQRDLVLPAGGRIEGVALGPDGAPVAGAFVFAIVGTEHRGRTRTDEAGRFRIEGLPAADYSVFVRAGADALVCVRPVSLAAAGVADDLRLHLRPPARLVGRVLDAEGRPVAAVELVVRGVDTPVRRQTTTDAGGQFSVGPLYDGAYRLEAPPGPLALAAQRLGVEAVSLAPLDLVVRDGQDLRRDLTVVVSRQ